MFRFQILIAIFGCLSVVIDRSLAYQCVDENGKSVDFLVVYKFPKLETSTDPLIRRGLAYAFTSSESKSNEWILSRQAINDSNSALAKSLKKLYSKKTNYVLYNDQPPEDYNLAEAPQGRAHAKGIVAFGSNNGIFITHSIPRFGDLLKSSFTFPDSARNNGQMFMCITVCMNNKETIKNIAKHLLLMRANVYSYDFSSDLRKKFDKYNDLFDKKWTKKEKTLVVPIYSCKSQQYIAFSKNHKFEEDLYGKILAPYYKEDLLVQSWRNGAGEKLDSDCKPQYQSMNVAHIRFNQSMEWKYTEDHSKWAISSPGSKKPSIVCISDINRMRSQFNRGGGSICVQSNPLWYMFRRVVDDLEPCPAASRPLGFDHLVPNFSTTEKPGILTKISEKVQGVFG